MKRYLIPAIVGIALAGILVSQAFAAAGNSVLEIDFAPKKGISFIFTMDDPDGLAYYKATNSDGLTIFETPILIVDPCIVGGLGEQSFNVRVLPNEFPVTVELWDCQGNLDVHEVSFREAIGKD